MKSRGLFITLEGGEGSGKTTMLQLLSSMLEEQGNACLTTREPGGIVIAEKIREVILAPEHTAMDARTEALLYAAARRQHLTEKVEPALEAGTIVLCDRFIDSSIAYQGHARGLGIEEVLSINSFATNGRFPDLTFFMDIEPEAGLKRIASGAGREVNRLDMESLEFHYKVREGYRIAAQMYPERIITIDASRTLEEVSEEVKSYLFAALKEFAV
ncbi:dTMP kinase [Paenibacillus ihumii]|uniref:dTMP kinase n=1 Tax=Paenibacillus ihumii TaxID=687436 RepID=UPI0006D795E4|nr:dTMP kinase [Paenibacillus ihumii]